MNEVKAIPHWVYQVLYAVAAFVTGGGAYKVYKKLRDAYWGLPQAEVHKTDAEATEIIIRSHSTAGDSVIRMIDRLEETQERIDEIRTERDSLILRNDLQVIEIRHREDEVKKLKALLDVHGIPYSEFDRKE